MENKEEDNSGCGCLGETIFIVIALIVAHFTIPSYDDHMEEISDSSVDMVVEHSQDMLDTFMPGVGTLAYIAIDNSDAAKGRIANELMSKNHYYYHETWFWSTCELQNRNHPNGKTASIGIFGFVIPIFSWNDLAVLDD